MGTYNLDWKWSESKKKFSSKELLDGEDQNIQCGYQEGFQGVFENTVLECLWLEFRISVYMCISRYTDLSIQIDR